jgi:hypothetical protein
MKLAMPRGASLSAEIRKLAAAAQYSSNFWRKGIDGIDPDLEAATRLASEAITLEMAAAALEAMGK